MKILVSILLVYFLSSVQSLKVLVCYPLPVKSLSILGQGAVRHLLEAGHEVTYITFYPLKNIVNKNFRQIDLSDMTDILADDEKFTIGYMLEHQIDENDIKQAQDVAKDNAKLVFQNEKVLKFLQDPKESYDAVLVDLFESEVYAGLAVLYDCPMIWLYSMGAHWQVLRLIHEGTNPAYDTDYLSSRIIPLNFFERVENLWLRIKWQYFKTFMTFPEEREIYKQTFEPLLAKRGRNGKQLPDYEEVIYNASLIFGNEHNAVKLRPSTPQNFKYIGGFHIEDPIKPLPKDLQELMDNAKHGVIYFSMGSFFKSKTLPKKLTMALLKIFGELKQTVIWKFEKDLPDVPKNVHIVHWAPQPSILAHQNIKMFITHGGLLSSIETIHFGVPTIGIPVSFDQFTNIKKAVNNGYALEVSLNYDLPENLKSAISVMLKDDSSEALKILVCYPLPVKSLSILGQGAVRHLLEAGHEVTYITVYPLKDVGKFAKNLRQIDVSNNTALLAKEASLTIGYVLEHKIEEYEALHMQQFAREYAEATFQNENVLKLLRDPKERYDVVFADLFESEVYAGLAVLYDCPMIWLYSMGAHWQVLRLIHEASNPAYETDYLSSKMAPLNFYERAENLWSRIKWQFCKTFITIPAERKIYEHAFGPLLENRGRTLPDYEEVIFNASFIFGNEHNAVKHRPSTPQNFKYIGGFHIEDPVKPLPKDLQDLMDGAKHGVIYFSMGSFFKSNTLPKALTTAILKVFGELKQTVIWKFEEDLSDVPKNVHIVHWAPQPSILAHPNIKIFITHGGLLSSIETIHFGVPTIGIPVGFDQFTNIKKAMNNGYALNVDLNYDLPKNMKAAINKMLNDDSYAKKASELSSIFHDRQSNPGAELVHWVEHVVRTRGAPHLRSPALHMPLYQRLYLDLAVCLVAPIILLSLAVKSLFKKQSKPQKSKQKKS